MFFPLHPKIFAHIFTFDAIEICVSGEKTSGKPSGAAEDRFFLLVHSWKQRSSEQRQG
jgi:hypothetical protein